MPALVAGIRVFGAANRKDVGGRDKPGHDDAEMYPNYFAFTALPCPPFG